MLSYTGPGNCRGRSWQTRCHWLPLVVRVSRATSSIEKGDALRNVYLIAAIAGLAVPYFFFGRFLLLQGLDLALLVQYLFANNILTFFAADLIITAIVFFVWSYREAQVGMRPWWTFVVATVLVGPSFSLPLFLYCREVRLHVETQPIT